MSEYLRPQQAVEKYGLKTEKENVSEVGEALAKHGIVAIEMPLADADFKRLSEGFKVCLEECPELLTLTAHAVDTRYGSEVGYTRKEKKVDKRKGIQTADPKNYFHFSEAARPTWQEQFRQGPQVLRDFLSDGYEVHDALLSVAKRTTDALEPSHPGISRLYFPRDESFSFLRLLRYDAYEPNGELGDVAAPHFDIGGVTIQAYADAEGFWAAPGGVHGDRTHYDTKDGEAYAFLGKGHEKVYGSDDMLKPLWHGVDRIIPAGVTLVPERTAVILFVDAPEVDYNLREEDTRPYLERALAASALVNS